MYGYDFCNSPTTHEFSRKSCHTARDCANTALMFEAFLSNCVPCEVVLVRIFIRSVSARACCVKLCCVKLCNALASSFAMCCVVLRCVSLRSGFLFAAWRKDPCFVFFSFCQWPYQSNINLMLETNRCNCCNPVTMDGIISITTTLNILDGSENNPLRH